MLLGPGVSDAERSDSISFVGAIGKLLKLDGDLFIGERVFRIMEISSRVDGSLGSGVLTLNEFEIFIFISLSIFFNAYIDMNIDLWGG